jgi:hypothetical protein
MLEPAIAPAVDKQFHLADLVGESNWQLDVSAGRLSFDGVGSWQVQLLGTESECTDTWLWAWANAKSNIPVRLLVASLALKAYSEQHGIPELTTPQLPLGQVDGHTLALLASGLCEANAYYRCPYEGGALYVLIMDESFPKCPDPPVQRITTVFPQAIAELDIPDHRLAFTSYLDWYKLAHESDGDRVIVRENGEPVLTATFDDLNRLTHLEATLNPTPPPKKNSVWDDELFRRMLGA